MSGAMFGDRLQRAVTAHGPVVAGIDPHAALLTDWGLPDTPAGLRTFARTALDAVTREVAAIKPQSAFFERHGSAGIAVLEELLGEARSRGVLSVLDVKRGDIGSTMGAYADAYLRPGAPLEADAVTLSPYLGFGSLQPALDRVASDGKGVFVLALTSNPEGPAVQHARTPDGRALARLIVEQAEEVNRGLREDRSRIASLTGATDSSAPGWGSVGLVIGATVGEAVQQLDIDLQGSTSPLLAPGFGAQGAGPEQRGEVFGAAAPRVLVSLSRGLLGAGPDPEAVHDAARALRSAYSGL